MKAPKKKDFKAVCKLCMNGSLIQGCPSAACLLIPIKDKKKGAPRGWKGLRAFCKSCDPEGFRKKAICRTNDGCPLEDFYNFRIGKYEIKGFTYV